MAAACPPFDGPLVAGLLSSVDCRVDGLVQSGYGALSGAGSQVAAALTATLTLFVAAMGLRLLLGLGTLRVGDVSLAVVKIGVVLALATQWPVYQQLVVAPVFQGPQELADQLLRADDAGRKVYDSLQLTYDTLRKPAAGVKPAPVATTPAAGAASPSPSPANTRELCATILLLSTLGVVLTVKVVLGVNLAAGPFFVGCLLFEATRGVFVGWLRSLVALGLAPLFTLMALALGLSLLAPMLGGPASLEPVSAVAAAPDDAILVITLLTAAASVAGLAASAVIGLSLRWPSAAPRFAAGAERGVSAAPASSSVAAPESAAAPQTRAAGVASAVRAMERREQRDLEPASSSAPSRRGATASAAASETAETLAPVRRSSLARSSASGARRDA